MYLPPTGCKLADESLPRFLKVLDQPFLTWSPWGEFKESVNLDVKKKRHLLSSFTLTAKVAFFSIVNVDNR